MTRDLQRELKTLKANLLYYEDLIVSHDAHVKKAASVISEAKKILTDILKDRDQAPLLIKQTQTRIKAMTVQVSQLKWTPMKVDPKITRLLALKEKMRKLEEELGI